MAVFHCISDLWQEAKHHAVAERVMPAPSKDKEHIHDINTSRLFFDTRELHAALVRIDAMYCTDVVRWEGRGGRESLSSCTSCCRPFLIRKRFGAMWVLFPWMCTSIMSAWLQNSPRHGRH